MNRSFLDSVKLRTDPHPRRDYVREHWARVFPTTPFPAVYGSDTANRYWAKLTLHAHMYTATPAELLGGPDAPR